MHKDFMNELKQYLEINEDRTIPKRDSRKILEATRKFLTKENPSLVEQIEKKYSKTIYNVIKEKILPFSVLMVAQGQIKVNDFLQKILDSNPEQKFIVDFIPEDQFLKAVDEDMYNLWFSFEGKPSEVNVGDIKLIMPTEFQIKVIDTVLDSAGIKYSYEKIYEALGSVSDLQTTMEEAIKEKKSKEKDIEALKKKLSDLSLKMTTLSTESLEIKADGPIPSGKLVSKKVSGLFPGIKSDIEVPCWEWDGVHPLVPSIQEDYIFREDLLMRVLYAIIGNKRMYLHGHTGSGKTTLYQQVAARLNYPCLRINFDSEITRMDLIGRDTLKDGESVFVDGMLPQMMGQPCIAIFDEIDFCRPDVAYVMQSALENNSLRLTEDGGREVRPHPMFRMFATGNTVGQGDELGMYQGARPQSLAFLDRFTVWAKVDYLDEEQRESLIKTHAPSLDESVIKTINKYASEHIEGFLEAKVLQPLSPRGILAVADAVTFFTSTKDKNPLQSALYMCVLDRANRSDYAVLKGIIDRVIK